MICHSERSEESQMSKMKCKRNRYFDKLSMTTNTIYKCHPEQSEGTHEESQQNKK